MTGVQTCALPIFNVLDFLSDFGIYGRRSRAGLSELYACAVNQTNSAPVRLGVLVTAHSEIIHTIDCLVNAAEIKWNYPREARRDLSGVVL